MIWATWWAWGAVALGLAILEVLMPTQIFLGFAIGAAFVGGVFAFDWPLASFMAGSLPWTLVIFAAFSLIAWLVLRRFFRLRTGSVKVWESDIND